MTDDANDIGCTPKDDSSRNENVNKSLEFPDNHADVAAFVPVEEQLNNMAATSVRGVEEDVQALLLIAVQVVEVGIGVGDLCWEVMLFMAIEEDAMRKIILMVEKK